MILSDRILAGQLKKAITVTEGARFKIISNGLEVTDNNVIVTNSMSVIVEYSGDNEYPRFSDGIEV